MGKEKEKKGVSFEGTVSMDTVLAYLDDLRARFEQGEVLVQNGSDEVLLIPDKSVRLSVRAREKDDEQSLRFEIAWDRTAPPRKMDALAIRGAPRCRARGAPADAVPQGSDQLEGGMIAAHAPARCSARASR